MINKQPVTGQIMKMIEDLCDIAGYGIHSGTRPGKQADTTAGYILDKLRAAGLKDAKFEPIKVHNPFAESYSVDVLYGDEQISFSDSCCPIQWTAGTPAEGIEGEIIYLGDGSESYFRTTPVAGKIVLIDERFMRGHMPTGRQATKTAKENGAIAVLRANLQVDSPQQQKFEGTPQDVLPIPAFSLSKSGGDRLRELVRSGTTCTARIKLDVPHDVRDAYNVTFELPGNGSTKEMILVGTHYDTGHFTGTVDNNGTVALMIKLAEYFAKIPQQSRNRDMIFAWCLGHDFDLNSGHHQFGKAHQERLKTAIVWDMDHTIGGTRYQYDADRGEIVPVEGETCEFYITSNNYCFSRLTTFTLEKYGYTCTHEQFRPFGSGPQWGMGPETSPWVNAASVPIYYHSVHDTIDKITLEQIDRAYKANIEILHNVDNTPEGLLFYDNISRSDAGTPPQVAISILSTTVGSGDTVPAWNDETRLKAESTSYHHPGLPEWAGTVWDWGDGSDPTIGGPMATHVYEKPGVYTLTMKFTDVRGRTGTATETITVIDRK